MAPKGPFPYPKADWTILITASRSSGEAALPFATPIISRLSPEASGRTVMTKSGMGLIFRPVGSQARPPDNSWDCRISLQKSKSVGARLAQRTGDGTRLQRERYPHEGGRYGFAMPYNLSIHVPQMLMLTI